MAKESLEEKFEKKKLEPRKISPEEQRSIDEWNAGREEREKIARKAEEAKERADREREKKEEFRKICEEKLMPMFEKIQSLFEYRDNSRIEWNFPIPGELYKICLEWDLQSTSNWGGDTYTSYWMNKIELVIKLNEEWDKESKFIISTLSESELIKDPDRNWIKKILLGDEPTKRVWKKKVTLNDSDWETQVEDYILEELKQKRAI